MAVGIIILVIIVSAIVAGLIGRFNNWVKDNKSNFMEWYKKLVHVTEGVSKYDDMQIKNGERAYWVLKFMPRYLEVARRSLTLGFILLFVYASKGLPSLIISSVLILLIYIKPLNN